MTSKKRTKVVEDGIHMPPGKCLIAADNDEDFKRQIDRLCPHDRKEVADFRRLLRKMYEKRPKRVP